MKISCHQHETGWSHYPVNLILVLLPLHYDTSKGKYAE